MQGKRLSNEGAAKSRTPGLSVQHGCWLSRKPSQGEPALGPSLASPAPKRPFAVARATFSGSNNRKLPVYTVEARVREIHASFDSGLVGRLASAASVAPAGRRGTWKQPWHPQRSALQSSPPPLASKEGDRLSVAWFPLHVLMLLARPLRPGCLVPRVS